jgi:amino-acid N-acetyltransferase
MSDAQEIQGMVNDQADQGIMLTLSLSEIFERLRAYYVFEAEGRVVGVCALHIIWDDLAEIRSLVVREENSGRGIGRRLVEACIGEAVELGIGRVFALTYQGGFFRKLGFRPVEKAALPQKVWKDCLNCVKFPDCDEEAFMVDLKDSPITQGG